MKSLFPYISYAWDQFLHGTLVLASLCSKAISVSQLNVTVSRVNNIDICFLFQHYKYKHMRYILIVLLVFGKIMVGMNVPVLLLNEKHNILTST